MTVIGIFTLFDIRNFSCEVDAYFYFGQLMIISVFLLGIHERSLNLKRIQFL